MEPTIKMEPTKKRAAKSCLNEKSSKLKRRLDFTNVLPSSMETQYSPASPDVVAPLVQPVMVAAPPAVIALVPSQDIRLALGGNKFLTYGLYNGEPRINIRLYEVKGSLLYPSKVGLSMTSARFSEFRRFRKLTRA